MVLISKEKTPPQNSLDGKLTGDIEDMDHKDKAEVMRLLYKLAIRQTPNYKLLQSELGDYVITLADNPDVAILSEINKKYAAAQAYHSRISAIEMQAISNYDAWSNLRKTVDSYILEKSSEYLIEEDIQELPNTAIQQAAVRNRLKKAYELLSKVEIKENEAKSFLKVIESKKGDMSAFITNLTRQVKVIALDRENSKR